MNIDKRPFEFSVLPECAAGQYARNDCTVAFYTRIGALVTQESVLLNVGAGRGANILTDWSEFRRKVQTFQGRVSRVIGIDIDPAVSENPFLDETYQIPEGGIPWPIADASVDIIVCDHVLEHVDDPIDFSAEALRVLKPGGWFCARTPTKWGYIGLGARLIPNRFHVWMLRRLQSQRQDIDVFPTTYHLNTFSALGFHFSKTKWAHHSYGFNGVPGYHANSRILFRLIEAWNWLMPPALSAKLHIFLRKLP